MYLLTYVLTYLQFGTAGAEGVNAAYKLVTVCLTAATQFGWLQKLITKVDYLVMFYNNNNNCIVHNSCLHQALSNFTTTFSQNCTRNDKNMIISYQRLFFYHILLTLWNSHHGLSGSFLDYTHWIFFVLTSLIFNFAVMHQTKLAIQQFLSPH